MTSSLSERTLQLSLISFKERVVNQQKRIEDLERENDRLRLVIARSSPGNSGNHHGGSGHECTEIIRQLEEANLQLRQRNLELTQSLLNKNLSLNSIRCFFEYVFHIIYPEPAKKLSSMARVSEPSGGNKFNRT